MGAHDGRARDDEHDYGVVNLVHTLTANLPLTNARHVDHGSRLGLRRRRSHDSRSFRRVRPSAGGWRSAIGQLASSSSGWLTPRGSPGGRWAVWQFRGRSPFARRCSAPTRPTAGPTVPRRGGGIISSGG